MPLLKSGRESKRCFFREPELQAKAIFEELLEKECGKFSHRQRRSFERRVRAWKRRHGTERELFFTQDHQPGERLQVDWMIAVFELGVGSGVLQRVVSLTQERTAECAGDDPSVRLFVLGQLDLQLLTYSRPLRRDPPPRTCVAVEL